MKNMQKKTKAEIAEIILKKLIKQYPKAKIALKFSTNMELLTATILSAQCTDDRVNKVTLKLFSKYKTVYDYANADAKTFENEIRSLGLFRNKAKNIIRTAQIIYQEHEAKIPGQMQELVKLPGVGRKTANVFLSNAFGKNEGIAVDTHVKRLSHRIGLSQNSDPIQIEQDLMKLFPKKQWGQINNIFIAHGRSVCTAQKPKCRMCNINRVCLFKEKNV
ncbi:MAG: endonuclease III [Candidatus Omnitrophota bacterium]